MLNVQKPFDHKTTNNILNLWNPNTPQTLNILLTMDKAGSFLPALVSVPGNNGVLVIS